ncbi:ATP-binding cassette domain-containing protein [Oenococcus sp.]|uniref:ABC transporter ATP-binding protein n=1 Tax=Oenococcus sp. TaxID=1979414 RepID=UPI0039E7BB83
METVLHIKHLQKNFGKTQALKDISFDVHKGEVFAFIGPNGAGKSTTIRIALGLLKKSGGEISLFGKDVFKNPVEIHKNLAYVPGDVSLWPNLTGGQTIDLLLRLGGQKRSHKTLDLIKEFDLDPGKKNRTYSKGNRQKVALIAAFSADVDFYIFDEPTSGLDPLQELNFQQEILKLKAAGKTILLSSHILSEIEKIVDRLAIIRQGKIIEVGALADLKHLSALNVSALVKEKADKLAAVPGVRAFKQDGSRINFTIDREHLSEMMQVLATLSVTDLQVTPPSLEELFLHFYDGGQKKVS